ncbi:MAG: glycosyltransferase family 2 protein [Thermoanaerobaculia bacterium]
MKLIVQIPAYNEEQTIAATLREIPKKIDGVTSIETLVIDDGSTDQTTDAARKAGATHIVQLRSHRGLSAAFVAGIDAALRLGADIIVNTDADNQYAGADIARLVTPIIKGTAEVVIGDREVANSPHMSGFKRWLQQIGSWTVGLASGLNVRDVTSGFRAFSREAAMQINVFNPFTYTLETVIQAGNRNLGVQSVSVRTNAPTRPSRLYRGIGTYLRKSVATIFRIYTLYRPLKTFFLIGTVLLVAGFILGGRFLFYIARGEHGGHIQSLILAAVFLVTGFQTLLIALLADLIAVNRRLSEDVLIRLKRMEMPASQQQRPRVSREAVAVAAAPANRPPRAAAPKQRDAAVPLPAEPQWVWLLDEDKLQDRGIVPAAEELPPRPPEEEDETLPQRSGPAPRRRRRRRGESGGGAVRPRPELPGNRGKHLSGEGES